MYRSGCTTTYSPPGRPRRRGSGAMDHGGRLPARADHLVRAQQRGQISTSDFADKQTIAGNLVELVYTRVSVTNRRAFGGDRAVRVASPGRGLVELDSKLRMRVAPGATVQHDFVAAGGTPSAPGRRCSVRPRRTSGALSYDLARSCIEGRGSPTPGSAATSNWPTSEGRACASSGPGNPALRRAVCRTRSRAGSLRRLQFGTDPSAAGSCLGAVSTVLRHVRQ